MSFVWLCRTRPVICRRRSSINWTWHQAWANTSAFWSCALFCDKCKAIFLLRIVSMKVWMIYFLRIKSDENVTWPIHPNIIILISFEILKTVITNVTALKFMITFWWTVCILLCSNPLQCFFYIALPSDCYVGGIFWCYFRRHIGEWIHLLSDLDGVLHNHFSKFQFRQIFGQKFLFVFSQNEFKV